MRTFRRSVRCAVATVLLPCGLAACGGGVGDAWDDGFSGEPHEFAVAVFDRVNQERSAAGVAPVQWHESASSVAEAHAIDMDERHFFAHTNPDGLDPGDRLASAGIGFSRVGENIAAGQDTPDEVMAAWMSSSGHRATILSPEFTHVGIGVHGSGGGTWWTQDFFRP